MTDNDFKKCPKYNDCTQLSDGDLELLAKKLYVMAKEEAKIEIADNVISFSKDALTKLFFILGAIFVSIVFLAEKHGYFKL